MELTVSLLLDLVILGLLLYCLIQGLRRGFILTLCSLLAVLLAFLGGWYLATTPPSPWKRNWNRSFSMPCSPRRNRRPQIPRSRQTYHPNPNRPTHPRMDCFIAFPNPSRIS